MPLSLEVVGSNVRDFCMLERNFLSHIKLVLLLILLLVSALLEVRFPGPSGSNNKDGLGTASLPVAILQLIAALATIAAAVWEYHSGFRDLLGVKAFFAVARVHFPLMALVTVIIVVTSVIYMVYSAA